ncbi:hypothetical protein [Dechloromonas denitrificans]|uniref:hypothetical protein n=1 Tax=Dechloromonas denitrificans TaxID=281362 RepID=UPI001CFC3C5B|nr:hypothetical protein [Dechloromonas denitrificans]UCV08463.1 hypothetical protein KI615_02725 [Dechloromonas denitrificans]
MAIDMRIAGQRMVAIFNEWAKRYADNPGGFGALLGSDGRPVSDYGEGCALYFEEIEAELEAAGALPKQEPAIGFKHAGQ